MAMTFDEWEATSPAIAYHEGRQDGKLINPYHPPSDYPEDYTRGYDEVHND